MLIHPACSVLNLKRYFLTAPILKQSATETYFLREKGVQQQSGPVFCAYYRHRYYGRQYMLLTQP